MMKHILYNFLFLALFFSVANASPSQVTSVKIETTPQICLVLTLNKSTTYTKLLLKNPNRLVLDLTNTAPSTLIDQVNLNNTPIESIKTGIQPKNTLRIVLQVNNPNELKIAGTMLNSNYQIKLTVAAIPKPITRKRDIVVVIDPGHGGQDPGASGPNGTREKNITLAIGLDLRRDLQQVPGIKVYMTRDRDVYPSLSQRLALARKVKADICISIHADAYKNRSARGATVFALSQGRANSEAAHWIAERENKSELLGGVELADKNATLRSVLVDLSQTATIGLSLKLGDDVLGNLSKFSTLHSHRVEQASLYVLTSPDIPAILVETGFISNPTEERLLKTPSYQEKLALAIKDGIITYLNDNPTDNTTFDKK